jgi:hydroxyquinol 1,2-dioxygenase
VTNLDENTITSAVLERIQNTPNPRVKVIMGALIRHLHDFAREVRLTEAEWMAAIRWLTRTGQISDDKREEFILASDVLGLSMLVVQMNHRLSSGATPATVLGPFHIEGSPELEYGADMSQGLPGTPLVLRGKYTTREDGSYCVRTVAPLGYSIPMDGPVGDLISQTDISHFRPAHVHFLINVPGYAPLITHLFEAGADYLDSDVVFGVKEELVVQYEKRDPGETPAGDTVDVPWYEARYDFVLQPEG